MKVSYFYAVLFFVLLCTHFKVSAQREIRRQIDFKLTDPLSKTSHAYRLNGVSYLISNPFSPQSAGNNAPEENCRISFDLAQDADPFLLKWISGEMKEATGIIILVATEGQKKSRSLVFTGGKVASSTESFINADTETATQINLYVKTLTVDDVLVFTFPKN